MVFLQAIYDLLVDDLIFWGLPHYNNNKVVVIYHAHQEASHGPE